MLVLSTLSERLLDAGFYLPGPSQTKESELVLVKLDDLELDIKPVHQPAGFVFHLGRCGSTATVNMLNSLEQYQVISEAKVFHVLAKALMYKPIPGSLERRKKLMDLFCLLGEAKNCKTIFKFASWEGRLRNDYSTLYPDVNCCLIVRNMLEIMVAVLNDPPGRFKRSRIRAQIELERSQGIDEFHQYLINAFGSHMDFFAEQDYVDFVGSGLQGMLSDVQNTTSPYLVIDHRDIIKRVPTDLCEYFGIKPDEQQIQVMQQRAGYNAKSMNRNERYADDSARKAVEATPETRKWCENTLQPLLEHIISKNFKLLNEQ